MGPRRDVVAAALIALPALLLAGLSLASSRAAFLTLGADRVLESARTGHAQGTALLAAADDNLAAAAWFESARYRTAAASARIAAAGRSARVPDSEIEKPIRDALAASPASPFNWLRFAWLRFRAGDDAGAATAWQMSVQTGRYKPPIMHARLELGLKLLTGQNRAFEGELREQIMVAARTDPADLARFASRVGAQAMVRAVLADDPGARARYDKAAAQVQDQILARMKAARK